MERGLSVFAKAKLGGNFERHPAAPRPADPFSDVSLSLPPGWDLACYDTETTDKAHAFCQVIQFAGLLANENYETVRRRDLRVRLLPYVVPALGALSVNGVDFGDLDDLDRHSEYDAAHAIRALLAAPHSRGRVYLTFNGLRFDDEILRRMLFRNLADPYFDKSRRDRRIDVLNLVRLVLALPDSPMSVGRVDLTASPASAGKEEVSYKLTALCEANGIDLANAHDALFDAEATFALANHVRAVAPWAWNLAFASGNKEAVAGRIKSARQEGRASWLFDPFAGKPDGSGPRGALLPCIVYRLDDYRCLVVNLEEMADAPLPDPLPDPHTLGFEGSYRDEEDGSDLRPFHVVNTSRLGYLLDSADAARFMSAERVAVLDDAAARFYPRQEDVSALLRHAAPERDWGSSTVSEESIYAGFPSDVDRDLRDRFVSAQGWSDRIAIALKLGDPRLRDFAARLILTNVPPERLASWGDVVVAQLREAASEAFERPHTQPPEDRKKVWVTVRSALDDPGCTDRFREWLATRYPAPAEDHGAEEAEEPAGAMGPR